MAEFNTPNPLIEPAPSIAAPNPLISEGLRAQNVNTQGIEPGRGQFATGLRAGVVGTEMGLRALGANIAETVGAPEYAKSQLSEINTLKSQMPRGDVTSVGQIKSLSDVGDFASYSLGQAIPTIATAAGGAVAGRLGARSLGLRPSPAQAEFMGATLGTFPQEAGEAALQMYESPEAMQRTPGERLAIASGKGAVGAALESIVPAAMVGRVSRGVAPALDEGFIPAARYVGREAVKAGGLESGTEVAQALTGQAAMKFAAPRTEELFPSTDELLTAAAAGFLPGSVMGGAGSTAEVVRSKLTEAANVPTEKFRGLLDTARNPQLSQFVDSLKPPADIVKQGQMAVAEWIADSGQINNVIDRARAVADDISLPDSVRQRAADLVDSGGDPNILSEFTGLVSAQQRGAEVGEAVRRAGSAAMRNLFGQRAVNDERFSAMSVPITEEDAPFVQSISRYLRDQDPQTIQMAAPIIKDYLLASNENSDATMPINMLSLFGPNQSREGLRAAAGMLQRMGVINEEATGRRFDNVIDDVLERQQAWRSLISTNLAPEYGSLKSSEVNKLANVLEALAVDSTTKAGERDVFMDAVNTAFGKNAPRALERMQALLPQSVRGTLAADTGMQELQQTAAAPLDTAEAVEAPTAAENLAALGLSERAAPAGEVRWDFANNQDRTLYDVQNPEQMGFMQSNTERLTRSGNAEAVPTGVAEYARLTGDTVALQQAQAAMPDATTEQLNDRFKVLGVYQTGTPEAEQISYDELVGGKSPWRSEFGAIKLYEPGKKRATLVTTPAKIIEQMRGKSQNITSELAGPEAAVSDFTRAVSALMTVEKSGAPAFERIEFMNKEGKYVPLSELPDSFSIFPNVTVGDARKALSERMQAQGLRPDAETLAWTEPQYTEMEIDELRSVYATYADQYRKARADKNKRGMATAKKEIDKIREEVRSRLKREGQPVNNQSIQEVLTETAPLAASLPAETRTEDRNLRGISEEQVTPGDIEAAELGPRLFQEETGELLQPAVFRTGATPRQQLTAAARRIADSIKSAPDSSLKRTILQELSRATDADVNETDMRGRVKAAERSALLNGLMSLDDAVFQHKGLFGTIGLTTTQEAAKQRLEILQSLKFTSLEPGVTESMSDQDKADVQSWIKRVVPNATVDFVKQLGGMSGSYSRDAMGNALIKINVFASDPLGVAFHEAVHDLFATLAGGKHQATLDMLQRVATSPIIKRQLFKLLDGNPAAQAQLSDPEEAAAYLFQFWMNDMVKLGPQTETFFNKIVKALKRFVGVFDDQELAVKVFTAFNEGKLRDPISRDEQLTAFNTAGYEKFKNAAKPITDRIGKLTDTVDSRFRESENPHLIEIIDNFNTAVGSETEKIGYYAAVAQARNRLINQLNESFTGYDREQLNNALEALQQETPINQIKNPDTRAIAASIRDTLDKLYGYMERKGVTNWEGKPIGKLENYFPRLWSVDELVANGDKFVDDLLANHKKDLDGIAKTANERNAKEGIESNVDARAIAEALLSKLTRNNGVLDDATNSRETSVREAENALGFSPAMNAANERVLKFLDMTVFSKYLQKDLVFAMTQYINQAVKRAEYSDRFGSDGRQLEKMMEDAESYEISKRLAKEYGPEFERVRTRALAEATRGANEPQATFEKRVLSGRLEDYSRAYNETATAVRNDFETYRAGVMALEGTLGHDISNELRQFNSVMMTYQNIRTIPLALLSSFIDPLGIMVRGGEMNQAYKAFTRGVREVVKSWKGEMTGAEDADVAMAEMLGTLEPSSYLDSLGQTYGSMFMTGKSRKINDFFFRLNGMEGWNRAMRTQATVAGIDFIKKLKTNPDKNTDRYLKELGLGVEDIVIKEDGSLDLSSTDKRLQFAIMRWVDGAVLRPNAAQRPAWASNPKFALLFHLNQFTYSFHKVILERMYNEAKNGNYDPLMVAAAGYVPVMLGANIIRAFIQGGGEEPDWMKGQDSLVDWVKRAVQSAGLTGIPGAVTDKLPYGLAGPTVQQAADAILRDQDLLTTFEKALPLQAIYRHW